MKKLLAVCLLLSLVMCLSLFVFADKEKGKDTGKASTITGWVSDEKCGAKNASAAGEACSKKCIEAGQKVVFVNDKDMKVWNVDNPEALKGHEGHHVKVKGQVNADAGTVHIENVKMMAATKGGDKGEEMKH
jgi:hypothetical protein